MARRSTRSRSTRSRQERPAKPPKPARAARAVEAEVVEETRGGGETGMVILTTVLLVAAILFLDALRGSYGEGVFF